MASSFSLHQRIHCFSPTPTTLGFTKCPLHISTLLPSPSSPNNFLKFDSRTRTVPFAVTESDSSKSLEPDPQILLREVADSFVLPADYLSQLPRDLRLDLNDAAFDLSNGPIKDECGEEVGETLLNISRAWERADTSTSTALVNKLPLLVGSLSGYQKSALGGRLLSAGRRFQSMGQYGEGEVQKVNDLEAGLLIWEKDLVQFWMRTEGIAKVMIKTGRLLSASPVSGITGEEPKQQTRAFKFGELQVELTSGKAYVGAGIAFIFGLLSWKLSQGVESIQESSLQYANDNALLLAKSLRGVLLVMSYSSTILSAFSTVGLILLGGQLRSEDK